ncbi:MAG: tyrosine-type recombinase/integrase [Candidatus Kerfeldbacteria bacterium]|nr:tyrosine-type recombinase/integrase [Candidatus Kerfeldbacteria bacterium]
MSPAEPHASELERWIKRFLTYIVVERGASELTKRNYEFYLTRFLAYSKLTKPDQITLDDIRDFRLYLNQQQNKRGERLMKSTQNYHLIALRSFLKYLAKNDVETLAPEKIELAKTTERQVNFLEGEDLERLLEAPLATHEPKIIQARDKAILELLFSTGLRVSELARLKRDDVNLDKDEFTVRGKGGKLRVVFLSNQARHFIQQYLNQRRDEHPAMFTRHDRAAKRSSEIKPLTPRSIQRLVTTYAKLAGVAKRVTPHTLRHSYATDLLMNGADIRSVQSMLGHASITTTQIYTHITNQQLRDVYKAFHGRRRRESRR